MIDSFQDEHRFLSNFHPSPIMFRVDFENETRFCKSATVEHAFQALKATNPTDFEWVNGQTTPGRAKRAGRKIEIRAGWNDCRVNVMRQLLRLKFERTELRALLLATGDQELVEGNHWGDTFWGVCDGVGENNLGRLLMQVREEIGGSA